MMEMLQTMGRMFIVGVNGACAVTGFMLGCAAMFAVIGFIANIFGRLMNHGENEED